VPGSLNASNFDTLVSFDVRPKVGAKLPDALTHLCGVALNLRDVEYETRCFQSFKFHFIICVIALSRRSVSLITNEIKVVGHIARSFTAGQFGVPH